MIAACESSEARRARRDRGPNLRRRRSRLIFTLGAILAVGLLLAGGRPARGASTRAAGPGRARLVFHGPRRPEVALTFDDGDCRACVAGILRVLEQTGAHATICPNGRYGASVWDPQRGRIRRLIARGQLAVCNHTYSHANALALSEAALADELERNERWIEQTFGVTSLPYFRPPYGAYDAATLRVAERLGYTRVVLWSGTLADSSPRTVAYEVAAIRYWARPGAIILAHGNYPPTAEALPRILRALAARGLRPVTLPELLRP